MIDYLFQDSFFEMFCRWAGIISDTSSTCEATTSPIGATTSPIG
jgi:hypothetical protein